MVDADIVQIGDRLILARAASQNREVTKYIGKPVTVCEIFPSKFHADRKFFRLEETGAWTFSNGCFDPLPETQPRINATSEQDLRDFLGF